MSDSNPDPRKEAVAQEVLTLASRALGETLGLQAVCASLMTELAKLDASPQDKLGGIVANIQGMVHSVAMLSRAIGGPHTDDMMKVVTQVVDQICSMAEAALQASEAPPKTL